MSSLSDFIGGGGGGGGLSPFEKSDRTFEISNSGTFTFPYAGTVDIYAIGGGGFGGFATGDSSGSTTNLSLVGTGGGAGGTAVKRNLEVSQGDTITIAVGARAEISFGSDFIIDQTVTNAGATTVNSNNLTISLTANGGNNGNTAFSATDLVTTASLSGGTGGTGSGGDENYTGGRGGNFTFTATPNVGAGFNGYRGLIGTGGGSVGLNANGTKGGDAVLQFNTGGGGGNTDEMCSIATAGGSVGQEAPTITVNSGGNSVATVNATVSTASHPVLDYTEINTGSSGAGASVGLFGPGSTSDNRNTSRQFSLPDSDAGDSICINSNAINVTNVAGGLLGGGGGVFVQGNAGPTYSNYASTSYGGGGAYIQRHNDTGVEVYGHYPGSNRGAGGGAYCVAAYATGNGSTMNDNHKGGAGVCVIRYKTITEA